MTKPIGRPHKEVTKSVKVWLRLTQETADTLNDCAEALNVSKTEVIEQGIDLVDKQIKRKRGKAKDDEL